MLTLVTGSQELVTAEAWQAVLNEVSSPVSAELAMQIITHLPRLFGWAMKSLLSSETQVASAAAEALKSIIDCCISVYMEANATAGDEPLIAEMFGDPESGVQMKLRSNESD
ncbi:RRP12-like protein [Garra rufa]|uniref:RRP12-like protein n=1 Tax=Garra rufa TaxID=137080 RepID=UPI003CCE5F1E